MLELFIAICIGVCCGIVTGIVPGIHINMVSLLLITFSPFFLTFTTPLALGCFIIAMGITHTFLDFIPGVFLGAPDADTAAAILPGHKMLMAGEAYNAVKLSIIGAFFSLILSILLMPITFIVFPLAFTTLKPYIGILLIITVLYMILKDKTRIWNFFIFLLSGILGIIVLSLDNFKDPLFPLLSGLFGVATLFLSLNDNTQIPKQEKKDLKIDKKETIQAVAAGTAAGTMTSFFPGLGSSQGAVLASQCMKKITDQGFILLTGAIGTVNFVVSIVSLATIEKARNGAVIAILEMMGKITPMQAATFSAAAFVAGGIAVFLALSIAKVFSRLIEKVNYRATVITVMCGITILAFIFGGWLGLFILLISTCVGLIPAIVGAPRNHAMGCLILPVILYFVL